jgi:hypothetical protein
MQKTQAILQRIAEGEISLDLYNRGLTDADVKEIAMALKNNHSLTELVLSSNKISDAGVKDIAMALKDNHSLTTLFLYNNEISDPGAKDLALALKDNHTLTRLDLSKNAITDAGAKDIARALKDNHPLTRLDLGDNEISDAGAYDLIKALRYNHTLTELGLSPNKISNGRAEDITEDLLESLTSRNKAYRKKHTEALHYHDIASTLLNSHEIDEACLSSLNEVLDNADKIIEDLHYTGYNQAQALSRDVDALRALAHLRTGNIGAGLDLYINKLQPQPPEAVSIAIANLILDEQPLPDQNANRKLILMCLRGTTQCQALQYNALQKLRGIDKFLASQPFAILLGVDKIVSVLDVSKANEKKEEIETCIFYEDLVLSPQNPPVHKVFKGEIPPRVELRNQFELEKKALLDSLKLAYPEIPSENLPTSSRPSME